ncbi:hypothetical protein GCM10007094_03930 [Pseudovibrio japonicus]|uniref:Uncharacterized protein n=1 Tax=Pseudovibrio japonicus TaxID=366534 RepID=A0ABQ3E2R8_9HYPH|nr:hypothetical protein GCM10007094_03930 [Pseudovibrio japonicus]
MARHCPDAEVRIVCGFEKWKSTNVVQVRVGEEQVNIPVIPLHNLSPEISGT